LSFANHLRHEFVLQRVLLVYDGNVVFNRKAPAGTPLREGFIVLTGPGTSGNHTLQILVGLAGNPLPR
jgi:hypothetical protein